jgi:hypothetical protein
MITKHIGVVYCKNKKTIKAVINPDYEEDLDDICWVTNTEENENLAMIKVNRIHPLYGVCPDTMNAGDCSIAIKVAKELLGWKE